MRIRSLHLNRLHSNSLKDWLTTAIAACHRDEGFTWTT